jgi:hypothetical protein
MNVDLSAHGLDQTAQYSNEILLALDSEVKQIAEVIAAQQAQEKKFDLLFEQLEKLNVTANTGGSEATSREAVALVGQFASALEIDRAEVREALKEMSTVGKELGGIFDTLHTLDAQVISCCSPFIPLASADLLTFMHRFKRWVGRSISCWS